MRRLLQHIVPGPEIDIGERMRVIVDSGQDQVKGTRTGHAVNHREFALPLR